MKLNKDQTEGLAKITAMHDRWKAEKERIQVEGRANIEYAKHDLKLEITNQIRAGVPQRQIYLAMGYKQQIQLEQFLKPRTLGGVGNIIENMGQAYVDAGYDVAVAPVVVEPRFVLIRASREIGDKVHDTIDENDYMVGGFHIDPERAQWFGVSGHVSEDDHGWDAETMGAVLGEYPNAELLEPGSSMTDAVWMHGPDWDGE